MVLRLISDVLLTLTINCFSLVRTLHFHHAASVAVGFDRLDCRAEAAKTERNPGCPRDRLPDKECYDRHAGEAHSRNATESC